MTEAAAPNPTAPNFSAPKPSGSHAAPADLPMQIETDVLIIGAGIAGAIAAITAADAGARVIILHRGREGGQANTYWAQGGIIYQGEDDSPDLLARDIMEAGAGLCNPEAVRVVAERGPGLVKALLLDGLGVKFDRAADGRLDITDEAAHSRRRIIHAEDRTGMAISSGLARAMDERPNIRVLSGATAVDLLTLSHHSKRPLDIYAPPTCVGAYVFFQTDQRVRTLLARETILATGGMGQLFLHTTNPRGARGDGIAMAYRAGARLLNLEYVQFHPTAFYHETAPRFLISESLRGEGARLIRRDGEEFMERYDPRGTLAPRDIVARAIHEEMLTRSEPCVYLDISHRPAEWIRARFPGIHTQLLEYGVDITREPIPVVPAAHYSCGGVAVDLEGRTSIRRLRAIGEVACTGLHGANRLASTSLLEGLVFGRLAAEDVIRRLPETRAEEFPPIESWVDEREQIDPALILQDWLTIKYTMWNYVGLVRTGKRLRRARQILRELQTEIETFYGRARLNDDLIGLRNGAQAALAALFAATENRVSRGCHYRVD